MNIEKEHLHHSIQKFTQLTNQSDKFPTVTINWNQPRNEAMVPTAEAIFPYSTDGDTYAALTFAASPHTTELIHTVDMVRSNKNKHILLSPDQKLFPAHCVVWWGPENNQTSIPINKIYSLDIKRRQNLLNEISDQTNQAVELMEQLLPTEQHKRISKRVRIYGVWGHATQIERTSYGLARGAQSHPDGHLHVVYFGQPDVESRELTDTELLKQLGSWDTVIHENFEAESVNWLRRILHEAHPEMKISIHAKQDHANTTSSQRVQFFEGYTVKFSKRISLAAALDTIALLSNEYDSLYETTRNFYTRYHTSTTSTEKEKSIQNFFHQMAGQFHEFSAKKLAKFVLSIPPTRGQYEQWKKETDEKIISEPDELQRQLLYQLSRNYESHIARLEHHRQAIRHERGNYIQQMQSIHDISQKDASLLLSLSEDRTKPASEAGQFIFPVFSSGSFMISNYIRTERGIEVEQISISTRLGTNKGVVEDLEGIALRRIEGK